MFWGLQILFQIFWKVWTVSPEKCTSHTHSHSLTLLSLPLHTPHSLLHSDKSIEFLYIISKCPRTLGRPQPYCRPQVEQSHWEPETDWARIFYLRYTGKCRNYLLAKGKQFHMCQNSVIFPYLQNAGSQRPWEQTNHATRCGFPGHGSSVR